MEVAPTPRFRKRQVTRKPASRTLTGRKTQALSDPVPSARKTLGRSSPRLGPFKPATNAWC